MGPWALDTSRGRCGPGFEMSARKAVRPLDRNPSSCKGTLFQRSRIPTGSRLGLVRNVW